MKIKITVWTQGIKSLKQEFPQYFQINFNLLGNDQISHIKANN